MNGNIEGGVVDRSVRQRRNRGGGLRQTVAVRLRLPGSGGGQVLANGGLALLLCIADRAWPHPLWWYAFLGVMAEVTADTWATEIGGWSRT